MMSVCNVGWRHGGSRLFLTGASDLRGCQSDSQNLVAQLSAGLSLLLDKPEVVRGGLQRHADHQHLQPPAGT